MAGILNWKKHTRHVAQGELNIAADPPFPSIRVMGVIDRELSVEVLYEGEHPSNKKSVHFLIVGDASGLALSAVSTAAICASVRPTKSANLSLNSNSGASCLKSTPLAQSLLRTMRSSKVQLSPMFENKICDLQCLLRKPRLSVPRNTIVSKKPVGVYRHGRLVRHVENRACAFVD